MNYVTEKQSEQFINQLLSQIDNNTMFVVTLAQTKAHLSGIHPPNK